MDFNSSTARKLSKPQSQPKTQANSGAKAQFQPVAFSKFEILLTTVCSLIICGMMVALVSTKIDVNTAQHHYQDLQTKITQVSNANASHQQEISEMTSQSHLQKIAQKYNLKDSSTNVRNVNK